MTDYDRHFDFTPYDLFPPEWDFYYEPPLTGGLEAEMRVEFPSDWAKVFKLKAFTVEATDKHDAEDIVFWGAVWLNLLGFSYRLGLFIGWR